MTVEDQNVVDIISLRQDGAEVTLTISDHLEWTDTFAHQMVLQNKLNRYLAFVESGELLQRYPAAKGGSKGASGDLRDRIHASAR